MIACLASILGQRGVAPSSRSSCSTTGRRTAPPSSLAPSRPERPLVTGAPAARRLAGQAVGLPQLADAAHRRRAGLPRRRRAARQRRAAATVALLATPRPGRPTRARRPSRWPSGSCSRCCSGPGSPSCRCGSPRRRRGRRSPRPTASSSPCAATPTTRAGGHARVRGEVLEDVALARAVRVRRPRPVVDGTALATCRMYDGGAGSATATPSRCGRRSARPAGAAAVMGTLPCLRRARPWPRCAARRTGLSATSPGSPAACVGAPYRRPGLARRLACTRCRSLRWPGSTARSVRAPAGRNAQLDAAAVAVSRVVVIGAGLGGLAAPPGWPRSGHA